MNSLEHSITVPFLVRFTVPPIIMMLFNSIYVMVDGAFVSNFIGTDALSAVNIVYPIINLVFAVGIMLATGGSAIVGRQLGEGNEEKARQNFSLIVCLGVFLGLLISIVCLLFTEEIVYLLGSSAAIYSYCYDYARCLAWFIPVAVLQMIFQTLFTTAGKPHMGLFITLIGGILNIIFDYILIVPFDLGIRGAALATGLGFLVPALIGLFSFSFHRSGSLYFVRPKWRPHILLETCGNGSSEMVSNLALAVTTVLFNLLMMKYLGEDGVAAITIALYAQFLFTAVFYGYVIGTGPLISYNYGKQDHARLQKLFRLSMRFILLASLFAFLSCIFLSGYVIGIFAGGAPSVFALTKDGMKLFSVGFFFMGFNIFASGMFTAFSNGKVSALLSFLRTFVFIIAAILILPALFEVSGIWLSIPIAECGAAAVSLYYIVKLRKTYHY